MATKTEKTVRVSAIRIQNVLGVREAEITPGNVTVIEGQNGSGKTSILEAIRAALTGGNDATLLRQGAEYGEVVLVLDNGQEITREITPAGSKVSINHPEFGDLKKPRSVIDQLCDSFALNPVEFLLAPKAARLQLLLAAIPLKVSERDLAGIIPMLSVMPDTNAHALQVLSFSEKDLYDQRTGVNRVAKEKRTTATELKKSLPAEASNKTVADDLAKAKAARSEFLKEREAKKQQIIEKGRMAQDKVRKDVAAAVDGLKANRDARIEEIRKQFQDQIDAVQGGLTKQLADISGATSVSLDMLAEGDHERELDRAVSDAEAAAQTYQRAEAARQHLTSLLTDAARFERKSEEYSDALKDLADIREALLEDLPIKGLSIDNGEITVDGIPFDRLNESRRVRLAIDVAMLRSKNLRLLCVDGIEALDEKSLAALEEHAKESGIQLILARVTNGPLNVVNVA